MTDTEIVAFLKNKFGGAKRGNGDWVRFRCPTCNTRDSFKMRRGLHLRSLSSNCFICQQPLSLEQIFGGKSVTVVHTTVRSEPEEHPQARQWPCRSYIPVSALPSDHPAVEFLRKDHLTDLTTLYMEHEVGYILEEDAIPVVFDKGYGTPTSLSVADSLIFPTYFKDELVGWQCRFIPGTRNGDRMKKMKYLHVFPKGNYLYNYDNAKKYASVVVVEGVKKSWKFDNAVATWGKGISEKQIQLIQEWDEIIFMYDSGDDTQKKIQELADIISRAKKCINIDPGKYGFASPDEMTADEAKVIAYTEWVKNYGKQ
jgi:hypothetical protein